MKTIASLDDFVGVFDELDRVLAQRDALVKACDPMGDLLEQAAAHLESYGLLGLVPMLREKAAKERDALALVRGEITDDD